MSENAVLPEIKHVTELLSSALGKPVRVDPSAPGNAMPTVVTAIYANDQGEPVGACVLDLTLAACLGAAMVLIPVRTALESVREGRLAETIADALSEVLNIMAQLFRPERAIHRICLTEVYLPGQKLPGDPAAALKQETHRLDAEVEIHGFVPGRMSLLSLA